MKQLHDAGSHIRVGLEDNLHESQGQLATKLQLTQRAARICSELAQELATPREARDILGTPQLDASNEWGGG